MKQFFLISKLLLACILTVAAHGIATAQKLPVVDGKETVAIVNDEPITLDEFNRAIADLHQGKSGEQKAGRVDFSGIMERLINIRLLLLEAKNMGIDELPDIVDAVEKYSKETLILLLLEQNLKDITPDDAEVERLYKEDVKEWKINAVKFKKETDAKKIEAKIKAGNNFDTAAQGAVNEGIAEGGKVEYYKEKNLILPIARHASQMKVGSISPIVSTGKDSFIIFKFEGLRYPEKEDPEARKKAIQIALNTKRGRAAEDYYSELKKKYTKIDEKLLDALDYESKEPGLDKLLQDKRVVAEIKGEDPINVGELSNALKKKYFHGIEQAIQKKKVNKSKRDILESMLEKRVLLKEAFIRGIDRTETYKNKVKNYENSVVFGTFIQKVIAPDIKLNEKELKAYYEEHSQKYTSPEMMRIKSLVFEKRNNAVQALDKLKKGTDFNWLSANAEGQVDPNTKGLLTFDDRMLILNTMPEDVQKALSNAKPGDHRLYESPEGHFYVLYVYHVVTTKLKPFEEVSKEIAKNVYNDKINKAVEAWADKLKEYYPVKIYRKDLRK